MILALLVTDGICGTEFARAALVPSLATSYGAIYFSDSRYPATRLKVLSLKGDLVFRPRAIPYEFVADGYSTAFVLSSTTEMRPGFAGVSARVGYHVLSRPGLWITLAVGWSYSTMRTEYYGYDQLGALLLRTSIRKSFSNRDELAFYVKYAPAKVAGGISFTESCEFGAGGAYTFGKNPLIENRILYVAIDLSTNTLILEDVRLTTKQTSIDLGMRF